MRGAPDKYARLAAVDALLFEELVRCGRLMICYPGHRVMVRKIGARTESAVTQSLDRLEGAGLIARGGDGRTVSSITICASGRKVDIRRTMPPRRRGPAKGGIRGGI